MTCAHTDKPCITGTHWCEWCKIPNAYGWFMELNKHGKVGWVQKWIREDDRAAIVAYYNARIDELERERDLTINMEGKPDVD